MTEPSSLLPLWTQDHPNIIALVKKESTLAKTFGNLTSGRDYVESRGIGPGCLSV